MDPLKRDLLDCVREEHFKLKNLVEILSPINEYLQNDFFKKQVAEIVQIICTDRNGDEKFDTQDIQLLVQEPIAIASLVKALLLLIVSLPKVKLTYQKTVTELLVFKLIAYIFLVIIPEKKSIEWTIDEKEDILCICMDLWNMFKASTLVEEMADKVLSWFKSRNWRSCCACKCKKVDKQKIAEKHLPKMKRNVQDARFRIELYK